MCKIIEEMIVETREETREIEKYEFALRMLEKGKLAFEEIAEYSGFTVEEVKEIASENNIVVT